MKTIIESISNRELAFLIWTFLILLFVIFKTSTRKAAANILGMIFWSKLTVYFLAIASYTAGIVYLLDLIRLWDVSQFKNTVFWFFTVGAASLFHATDKEKSNYLVETVKDVLSITAILQFLVGIYSFRLATELALIPLVFFIGGMTVVAEQNTEYQGVGRLLRKLIVSGGLLLICYTLFKIVSDFKTFASKGTLNDFLIPAVLSFLFLPMLYLLSIIITHEDAFTGIERRINHPPLRRYARWKVLIHFHANKTDLTRWRRLLFLEPIISRADVDKSIARIKEMKRKEKLLLPVEFEAGWSAYSAITFLQNNGIKTSYYQPAADDNDWFACSNYMEVDDNVPPSNISYYVEGDANKARKLTLSLSVYNGKQDGFAIVRFLEIAKVLFEKAVNQLMSQQIEDCIIGGKTQEMKISNRTIEIEKMYWKNETRGYHLNLKIEV